LGGRAKVERQGVLLAVGAVAAGAVAVDARGHLGAPSLVGRRRLAGIVYRTAVKRLG
jgi:hypothetical protein